MKKRKVLLFLLVLLGIGIIWVIEPLSLNPFAEHKSPKTSGSSQFHCVDSISHPHEELVRQANGVIDNYMVSNSFLGVSAGLLINNCESYLGSAGYASKGNQTPMNSTTIGRIASLSKPMTAVAIMQLYEQGKLDLDAPVQNYLKNFPRKAKGEITTKHLLKHTSGFPHYSSKWEALSFTHYSSLKEATDHLQNKELAFEPGTAYLYSSYGYTILGAIIEEVSQMTFGQYMKKHIWDVAGMSSTSLEERSLEYENKAGLYLKIGSNFIKSPATDLSIIYSAGGVQSTPQDLLKFGEAILNNRLIDSTSLQVMINATDDLAPAAGNDPYGYGWAVYDDPKYGRIIQHGGTQPGTSSFFSIFMDHAVVSVVMSNSFGSRQSAFSLSRDLAILAID